VFHKSSTLADPKMQMSAPAGLQLLGQKNRKGLQNLAIKRCSEPLPFGPVKARSGPLPVGRVMAAQQDRLFSTIITTSEFHGLNAVHLFLRGLSTGVPSVDGFDSGGCSSPASWSDDALNNEVFVPPPPLPHADMRPRGPKMSIASAEKANRQHTAKREGNVQPLMFNGIVLSCGSKNHSRGQCWPCQKCSTPEGCTRGGQCNFGHHPHDQATMMLQLRRLAQHQERLDEDDSENSVSTEPLFKAPPGLEPPPLAEQRRDEPWYIQEYTMIPVAGSGTRWYSLSL
jgi:hypothetical protein